MAACRSAFSCCFTRPGCNGGEASIYCNLSSWYVEPAFRNYAPMLTKIAQKNKEVTYLNISPGDLDLADHRDPGFQCLLQRIVLLVAGAVARRAGMTVETVSPDARAIEGLSEAEVELLTRHARYGCLSLVCRTAERRRFSIHPAADADPPRLDCAAGDATDLLPRYCRIRPMRRRHRPDAASARQDFGHCSMPMDRCRVSSVSFPRRAAANISRARIGPVSPT